MYNSVICSPFVEHPFVDVAQFDAGDYDLTIIGSEIIVGDKSLSK
jgi:hypothetical protein